MGYNAVRRLSVEEAKAADDEMNSFIEAVLKSGVDYGIVPKTTKPTLLKPGAEKILNFLGLIARTEVVNRVEDVTNGYFAYECKVYVIDADGVVRGEGLGITNSKETKYLKSTGFSVQNTVLKMAKKRALVDATLNVGSLSGKFTQDLEDLPPEADAQGNTAQTANKPNNAPRPASDKQLKYLETLMAQHGTPEAVMNRYVKAQYGVEDYHKISSLQASEIIEKFKAAGY